MKQYVIDASVAVKWFYQEPYQSDSLLYLNCPYKLFAPDIIQQEFLNTVIKIIRFQEVSVKDGWQSCLDLFGSDTMVLIPTNLLLNRAFTMAVTLQHPIYDCVYLATAERIQNPVVTADRKFYHTVMNHQEFKPYIRWIEDPPLFDGS